MFKALFLPAIAAMNRMNFVVKFLFIGLLLLLPFAYVTHVMMKGADKQIVFNRKESYGVEYITPAFRLLGHLQDCRTYSAAVLAGEDSLKTELVREQGELDRLVPEIDRIDERFQEDFKTEDGRAACAEQWKEIKAGWASVRKAEFKTQEESFAAYSEICALVTDWILNYAANYSNLILDPDLDSYWLMDAFVAKFPQITEDMSQACALSIALASRPKLPGGAPVAITSHEKLGIHGLYVDATNCLMALQETNLKTAYAYNNAKSKTLQPILEPLVRSSTTLSREFLARVKDEMIMVDFPSATPRELVNAAQKAMDATYSLYERVGPELKGLIDARVLAYQHDKTTGMIAAESATFLHVYLFIAFYIAVHISVGQVSKFTRRMIEGTQERFKSDSHDELGKVVESFNLINKTLNETRSLKEQMERRGEELKASEERFRSLASNAPVGIIMTDPKGDCLYVNDRWCKLAALTPEQAQGRGWVTALHPEDRERIAREWYQAVQTGREFISEYRFGSAGRSPIWLSGNAVPLKDGTGIITGFLGSVTDITERKKLDQMKNEFISTVSHELRTPLTSIRGSLKLIAGGVTGPLLPKTKVMIDIAHESCERLVHLVNDILDIEKIESGKMILSIKTLDAASVIAKAVEANQSYAQTFGVSLRVENDLPNALILADGDRLIQVLTNLMSNAVKFSPREETVTISLRKHQARVRISVGDHGKGIPEEFRPRIFQKFAQADGSDTRSKQGTGLGLSITKTIVEKLGGEISFESTVGLGTTFHVDLPPFREAVVEPRSEDSGRPRILICEDDAHFATVLRVTLDSAGFNADVAPTVRDARKLLAEVDYAGMTLDLMLPDQDGISFIRELRRGPETQTLPIVIVSAYLDEARNVLNGDAACIVDWLEKPVEEDRLKDALRRAVNQKDRRSKILHVEDDAHQSDLVRAYLDGTAEISSSGSLADARDRLRSNEFDLAILDMDLPDGSGLELLPLLRQADGTPIPIVVYSVDSVSPNIARQVAATLKKSPTSADQLVRTIERLLGNPAFSELQHDSVETKL